MTNPSRPESPPDEPHVPRSLGTLAAALATCGHPDGSHLRVAIDPAADAETATWCAACGALHADGRSTGSWQSPSLASHLTRKRFEDVVLLLHGVVQLTQLARAQGSPGAIGSSAQVVLRHVRASLSELARLPVVRDVDRLEEAIAAMPGGSLHSQGT
jgi:hypothetical protein